jgi:CobQ-like glutamine amidotransferase family enzyme
VSTDSAVSIGLLLPDVLGTYSDSGNATVLAQRLRWRGLEARVVPCPADRPPPTSCELYLLGGGEDTAQLFAARWLRERPELCRALSGSAVTLAVCAGMQILGRWMEDLAGERHPGAEMLDITTRPRPRRAIGDVIVECLLPGVGALCGFENHRGATSLGPDARPLGRVLAGTGNGAEGCAEGVLADRVVGTYLHGPVLARNPSLADHLLERVVGGPLAPLEVPDQTACRDRYLRALRR